MMLAFDRVKVQWVIGKAKGSKSFIVNNLIYIYSFGKKCMNFRLSPPIDGVSLISYAVDCLVLSSDIRSKLTCKPAFLSHYFTIIANQSLFTSRAKE